MAQLQQATILRVTPPMRQGMCRQVRLRLLLVLVAMVQMVKESHQIPRWQERKKISLFKL